MFPLVVMLLASAGDIVCGWQPMPDGSASYECIVQIEPEQIHKLHQGSELPLSVDIPDDVKPVRRIRIVVGRGTLPQQTLVDHSTPVTQAVALTEEEPAKKSRAGLIETQFQTDSSGGSRYPAQYDSNDILPPSNTFGNVQEAVSRGVQNGSQALQNSVTQVAQDILPPDSGQRLGNALEQTVRNSPTRSEITCGISRIRDATKSSSSSGMRTGKTIRRPATDRSFRLTTLPPSRRSYRRIEPTKIWARGESISRLVPATSDDGAMALRPVRAPQQLLRTHPASKRQPARIGLPSDSRPTVRPPGAKIALAAAPHPTSEPTARTWSLRNRQLGMQQLQATTGTSPFSNLRPGIQRRGNLLTIPMAPPFPLSRRR